jgi:D-lactate dehydrogenase
MTAGIAVYPCPFELLFSLFLFVLLVPLCGYYRTAMHDVFFYEAFAEEEAALRAILPESVRAGFTAKTIQECGHKDPAARLISLRTQSVIPPEWAEQLDAILSRSTGYDHLVSYRQGAGGEAPACGYLPLYCARAVAEQAMLMWMALLRQFEAQRTAFQRFERDGLTGAEAEGKNLLVVGVGHIGSEIIRIGTGLGMTVKGVDPVQKHDFVDYVSFEEALPVADIIVAAMNLTSENRGYFSRATLAGANPGALFVNISRGELSPSAELLALLDAGTLGGVALDVYEDECELGVALRGRGKVASPSAKALLELKKRPNVICTPHNAFNTREALQRKADQAAAQVRHFLAEGRFVWDVPGE